MKGAGHDHARGRLPPTPYPGEQYILSVDRYQIEVMDHLDELPATGAVIFCTFPKVRDGVGYPARVFAVCPAA